MSEIERLKRAEEAKPMAVVIIGQIPEGCAKCWIEGYNSATGWFCPSHGFVDMYENSRPSWCPIHETIGIIEPNGHVRYFVEDDNGNAD